MLDWRLISFYPTQIAPFYHSGHLFFCVTLWTKKNVGHSNFYWLKWLCWVNTVDMYHYIVEKNSNWNYFGLNSEHSRLDACVTLNCHSWVRQHKIMELNAKSPLWSAVELFEFSVFTRSSLIISSAICFNCFEISLHFAAKPTSSLPS